MRGRWLAGAAGIGAVGTIAGATVAHSMLNRRAVVDDPFRHEDFETLDGDRSYLVTTPDGVHLAVREVGPTDAPLTVVLTLAPDGSPDDGTLSCGQCEAAISGSSGIGTFTAVSADVQGEYTLKISLTARIDRSPWRIPHCHAPCCPLPPPTAGPLPQHMMAAA